MSNVFVLMKRDYEYNDEGYSASESGAGVPLQVFDTRQQAELVEAKCYQLGNYDYIFEGAYISELAAFKQNELSQYVEVDGDEAYNSGYVITANTAGLSKEQVLELCELCEKHYSPFYIEEVSKG